MRLLNDLTEEDVLHQFDGNLERTKREVEKCIIFVRLELYNRMLPCGPKAVRERCRDFYHRTRLPSERTITRILSINGLPMAEQEFTSKRNLAILLGGLCPQPPGFNAWKTDVCNT